MTALDVVLAQARARRDFDPFEARRIREVAGLSQAQIGQVVGVTNATVCRWESGERRPRGPAAQLYLAVLKRVAEAVDP